MKKGIKLALLAFALVGFGASMYTRPSTQAQVVYAEEVDEEPVIEQEEPEEVLYEMEDEGGYYTLRLNEDGTFEINAYHGEEFMCIRGNYLVNEDYYILAFSGGELHVMIDEETHRFVSLEYFYGEEEEPIEEDEKLKLLEEIKDWAKEKWDTFVAPLVGGLSATAILAFIANLFLGHFRNKSVDKRLLETQDNLVACKAILATIVDIKGNLEQGKAINQETLDFLKNQVGELQNKVDQNSYQMEKMAKIEPVLRLLVEIETMVAKSSNDAIKAGIVDKVKEVENLIKTI